MGEKQIELFVIEGSSCSQHHRESWTSSLVQLGTFVQIRWDQQIEEEQIELV